ncbi:hypothetical protein [Pseudomonas sp. WHRI 8519]|uniref:hypothetical protein n=1 Tax=Pseudomonas sp. WHRI 8519 TaxID=3162567 RepID=UPI0032EBB904
MATKILINDNELPGIEAANLKYFRALKPGHYFSHHGTSGTVVKISQERLNGDESVAITLDKSQKAKVSISERTRNALKATIEQRTANSTETIVYLITPHDESYEIEGISDKYMLVNLLQDDKLEIISDGDELKYSVKEQQFEYKVLDNISWWITETKDSA